VNDERKQAQVMSDMNSVFQARRKTKWTYWIRTGKW